MQEKIYEIDQGIGFGKWQDETSKFLYYESTKQILKLIEIPDRVADYGGGNGLLKQFIPQITTIDIDGSKGPDIVDDIITHKGEYDLIILRYVLHYLDDYKIIEMFKNIKRQHKGRILIQQFTNEDLISKYENSQNEYKYFRTLPQLLALIPFDGNIIYKQDYIVTSQFYKNRLQLENGKDHLETMVGYYV